MEPMIIVGILILAAVAFLVYCCTKIFAHGERGTPRYEPQARVVSESAASFRLDLHGYPVSEAMEELPRFIQDGRRLGREYVQVVTGRGIHSPGGTSPMKAAVEGYIRRKGYSHFWENDGMVKIYLY